MKKSILIFAAMLILAAVPVLYVNATPEHSPNQNVTTIDKLTFTEMSIDKVPQEIVDVILKEHKGCTIEKAAVAKTEEDAIYKISLKNTEGAIKDYLYKADGTIYQE